MSRTCRQNERYECFKNYKFLQIKITGKGPLGRFRSGCVANILTNLKEIGVDTRNLIDLTQDGELL